MTEEKRNTENAFIVQGQQNIDILIDHLNDAAAQIRQLEKENNLLREVHWQARTVFRYDGIDKTRTEQAVKSLKDAVYKVNDYHQSCGNG